MQFHNPDISPDRVILTLSASIIVSGRGREGEARSVERPITKIFGFLEKAHNGKVEVTTQLKMARTKQRELLHLALFEAIFQGDIDMCQEIINNPMTDLNKEMSGWGTPLMYACTQREAEIVKMLLENPQVNVIPPDDNDGLTIIMHLISENEDIEVVEVLIASGRFNLNAVDVNGKTALHYACMCPDVTAVQLLLEVPEVNLNAVDVNGKTALHYACSNPDVTAVQLLLEVPEVNTYVKDNQGKTAKQIALDHGNDEAVKLINERQTRVLRDFFREAYHHEPMDDIARNIAENY